MRQVVVRPAASSIVRSFLPLLHYLFWVLENVKWSVRESGEENIKDGDLPGSRIEGSFPKLSANPETLE